MYQQVKELRACIDKMYDAAMKQDDERRQEIETLKTYLSFALSAFESIVLAFFEIRLVNKHKDRDILPLLFLILCHGFCCGLLISRVLTDIIG